MAKLLHTIAPRISRLVNVYSVMARVIILENVSDAVDSKGPV